MFHVTFINKSRRIRPQVLKNYLFQEQNDVPVKSYWSNSVHDKEVLLDASTLGDVPAVYRVPQPAAHQMPVIGVYIDPRVRTGFRYKVRPMQVRWETCYFAIYRFTSLCGELSSVTRKCWWLRYYSIEAIVHISCLTRLQNHKEGYTLNEIAIHIYQRQFFTSGCMLLWPSKSVMMRSHHSNRFCTINVGFSTEIEKLWRSIYRFGAKFSVLDCERNDYAFWKSKLDLDIASTKTLAIQPCRDFIMKFELKKNYTRRFKESLYFRFWTK